MPARPSPGSHLVHLSKTCRAPRTFCRSDSRDTSRSIKTGKLEGKSDGAVEGVVGVLYISSYESHRKSRHPGHIRRVAIDGQRASSIPSGIEMTSLVPRRA